MHNSKETKLKLSIVVSAFNEEDVIGKFYTTITKILKSNNQISEYELLIVNDGSNDNTKDIVLSLIEKDKNTKLINLSRNFGHEAAIIAGIDNSTGDAILCLDSDLQHPPELIPEILTAYNNGYEIIKMTRKEREDSNRIRNTLNSAFYNILNRLAEQKIDKNVSDFFLISKRVQEVIKTKYRNQNRFIRVTIQNIGFKQINIEYKAPARVAGESKYTLGKLLKLAFNAFISTTTAPLKAGLILGLSFSAISFILLGYSIFMWIYNKPIAGYTTIITFLSFSFGILYILIGIIGEYLGKLFIESKNNPIYIIDNIYKKIDNEVSD